MTFTKEKLTGIIESADDVLQALAGTHEDIHTDSDKMCEAWNYLNDNAAPPAVVKRLAEIALASLEAEPVAWQWEYRDKNHVTNDPARAKFVVQDGDVAVQPLFTAPPAPVSVPAAIHSQGEKSVGDDYYALGWNACRAAMLQGADGALTNEDTKQLGELVMWVKRLAHSLRKANPDSKLQSDAMDYLSRKGLINVEDIIQGINVKGAFAMGIERYGDAMLKLAKKEEGNG